MTPRDSKRSEVRSCLRSTWMQISRKPLEIQARFQRTTKRKWHTANRMGTWFKFKMAACLSACSSYHYNYHYYSLFGVCRWRGLTTVQFRWRTRTVVLLTTQGSLLSGHWSVTGTYRYVMSDVLTAAAIDVQSTLAQSAANSSHFTLPVGTKQV